jgi:hypothetical protein
MTILVPCADNDSNNTRHFEIRKNNTVSVGCDQSNNQTVFCLLKDEQKDRGMHITVIMVDCCMKSAPFLANASKLIKVHKPFLQ